MGLTSKLQGLLPLLALLALPAAPWNPASAGVTASFRYPLSNFSGPVPSQWAKLAVDQERNEVYALNQRANDIRIFDEHGMEIFVFGDGYSSCRRHRDRRGWRHLHPHHGLPVGDRSPLELPG